MDVLPDPRVRDRGVELINLHRLLPVPPHELYQSYIHCLVKSVRCILIDVYSSNCKFGVYCFLFIVLFQLQIRCLACVPDGTATRGCFERSLWSVMGKSCSAQSVMGLSVMGLSTATCGCHLSLFERSLELRAGG